MMPIIISIRILQILCSALSEPQAGVWPISKISLTLCLAPLSRKRGMLVKRHVNSWFLPTESIKADQYSNCIYA